MNQMTENTQNNSPLDSGKTRPYLLGRLREIAHPPIFQNNEESTRRASILYSFLLGTLLLSILATPFIISISKRALLILFFLLFIEAVMAVGLVSIRRGRLNLTASITVTIFWLFIAVLSSMYGTVINPTTPTFIVIIFIAGLTLNSRAAAITAGMTFFYAAAYLILQNYQLTTEYLAVRPQMFLVLITFDIAMAAFLVIIANRTTNQALDELNNAREELLGSNQELSEMQKYLEETVTERTNQLEKRNSYLEAASQVAKETLATLDLQEMLENITRLISEQFGFYHVGIFLLDDRKEFAVLKAVSSIGGQKMLARNHRLEVGKQGMVGFVTSIGQARISQDTEMDRIHSVTAELPDTRSEMVLPLKSRGQIIGALDIQDSEPNAFLPEDIPVLQTVADQIALAVENIRLYQQTQETMEEIQRVYGEYSQQAWFDTYQKNLLNSYRYASGIIEPIKNDDQIQITGSKVSVPINIRGYNIGAIEISKGENSEDWSDDDVKLLHKLSEQLGIALDSARLYNETQLRASTEHVISQINSELRETLEINSILKTAAAKLREALSVPELTVRLAKPTDDNSNNGNNGSNNHSNSADPEVQDTEN